MKKFEIIKENVEIKAMEYEKIKAGCTIDCQDDHCRELVKAFDTLEEARNFMKKLTTTIADYTSYYAVEEYYIEENDYEYDDLSEEWEVEDSCIWDFSEMKIELVEKPSYETVATFDNMEDAKEAYSEFDGECFLSF